MAPKAQAAWPKMGRPSEALRDLGRGWKISPFVRIQPGETFTLADIQDSGGNSG